MKTLCIYHSIDLDGWMSAAIVKHWFKSTHEEGTYSISSFGKIESVEGYFDNDKIKNIEPSGLTFLGFNYGDPIPDVSQYDKIIMCDISLPTSNNEYAHKLGNNFIWLDHHQSAIKDHDDLKLANGIRDTKFAACELTWKYFFPDETMPEIVRLLGRYDCFGHKGTSEEKKVLEFQYGARMIISNHREAYELLLSNIKNGDYVCLSIIADGTAIYNYLCAEARLSYKHGFPMYFELNPCELNSNVKKFLCINKERFNPINFGIDYHQDGYDGVASFWYEGKSKLWKFSLYNDNGQVDCSAIAQQFGGGGHKGAAGFVTPNLHQVIK